MAESYKKYAKVAVPVPLRGLFTYSIPHELEEMIEPGAAVEVVFGRRKVTGFVFELSKDPSGVDPEAIKEIIDCRPAVKPMSGSLMELLEWASSYYLEPIGEMVRAAIPPGVLQDRAWMVSMTGAAGAPAGPLAADMERIMTLLGARGPSRLSRIVSKSQAKHPRAACEALARMGAVSLFPVAAASKKNRVLALAPAPEEEALKRVYSSPRGGADLLDLLLLRGEMPFSELEGRFKALDSKIASLMREGLAVVKDAGGGSGDAPSPRQPGIDLSSDQMAAVDRIGSMMSKGYGTVLLHGVTGSGKTEVYIRCAEKAIASGKTVLYLVPEISLTPQLAARLRSRITGGVAVLHSGMKDSDRLEGWRRAAGVEASLVLGTRSAVFAPLENIGLVIVDEEHEAAYKQEESPRYNGRDLAIKRAQIEGAVAILGSATPSVESYRNTAIGKSVLMELPDRVTGHPLPDVEVLDLGERRRLAKEGRVRNPEPAVGESRPFYLTSRLMLMLGETLSAGRQAILLLNRRGYSSFVCCRECGRQFICDNCSVSMTYHAGREMVVCHYCGSAKRLGPICPECGKESIVKLGLGTERVEAEVRRAFPSARVLRLDRDVASDFGEVERIIASFESGGADVLVGTQMVAKGHHFPCVTFVGIVMADIGLMLPDFRAGERLFGLLSQVAGRSGRGEEKGRVLVQTFNPHHYAVEAARLHDYAAFYGRELETRRTLDYPPFSRLTRLVFESHDRDRALAAAERFSGALSAMIGTGARILGPAPSVIEKVRRVYRFQLLIKGRSPAVKRAVSDLLFGGTRPHAEKGVRVVVDIDPAAMI